MAPSAALRAAAGPVLVVACAVAVSLWPGARSVLVYDRAAILSGEPWRLVTGHWTHVSVSHLVSDVTILGMVGVIVTARGYGRFLPLCVLSAAAIGLAMLVLLPDMATYGGLSGVAMAVAVSMGLHAMRDASPWRELGGLVLLLCAGRLVLDATSGGPVLADLDGGAVVTVPLSHVAGAACGVAAFAWGLLRSPHPVGPAVR